MPPMLTIVEDILYDPMGDPVNGRLIVTNTSTMISPDGDEIPEGTTMAFSVVNGAFSFGLVPNLGSTPNGTSYSVKYQVTMQYFEECWVVPQHPNPCRLSDVRALSAPIPSIMIPIDQVLPPSGMLPGDVPTWDGVEWIPGTGGGGSSVISLTAGMNISSFQAVAVHADGLAYVASASNLADVQSVVGVAISSALMGNSVQVQSEGLIQNFGFLFTPGKTVFLGLGGALIQTFRVGLFEQPLGVAISASQLNAEVGRVVIYA